MRYFVNTSAGQPLVTGGLSFDFELVGIRGGTWFGVLAVDEPAASILASSGLPNVGEISQERFDSEKKKEQGRSPSFTNSHQLSHQGNPFIPPDMPVAVADRAGSLTPPPTVSEPSKSAAIESETLHSSNIQPPSDPLLQEVKTVKAPRRIKKA